MKIKSWRLLLLLMLCSVACITVSLGFGSATIPWSSIVTCVVDECADPSTALVLWELRLPRILMGFIAGAALSVAGATLQNVTRNPLADPYLFGIVSGAGLGIVVFNVILGLGSGMAPPVAAFIGSILAIAMVLVFNQFAQFKNQLILIGVAVSFLFSALSQFLLYVNEPFATNRIIFWLLGSLTHASLDQVLIVTPVVILVVGIIVGFSRRVDAILVSDQFASSLGVRVNQLRIALLLACALLTAIIVAYCGGIAFVGLMVPHLVRALVGTKTLLLVVASFCLGGCFLIIVDILARLLISDQELPLGVVTGAMGSVFFLLILLRRSRFE